MTQKTTPDDLTRCRKFRFSASDKAIKPKTTKRRTNNMTPFITVLAISAIIGYQIAATKEALK